MLSLDANLVIVFAIVWILLVILKKVLFNPLRRLMDNRSKEVQGDLEACQEAAAAQEKTIREIEERLKAARISTRKTHEKFVSEALKEKERMSGEVARECRAKVDEAKRQLKEQMEDLKKALALESALLAEKIEQRLLH